ncbi:globin-coupled sensor protein [Cohnella herbarum]|uniref:Chemotaxis protein n=1 Tax=Cohnella herbarum TaxID=2728023 RepID=A0A7Z2VN84_9BACL|nr:globin-coupled sensor protein [Cohnella herbarum]QJD86102.1 chemotaxis protein [Cohnella herbarum]
MTIEMGNDKLSAQLKMIDLTKEDIRMIQSIQPVIIERINEIIDVFYATILKVTTLRQIITDHSTIERLRTTLTQHIIELFSGHIDNEYVLKRLRIAVVHQRIGLEPKWYIGSFQNLQNTFLDIIHGSVSDSRTSLIYGKAVTKLLNFEQQLVLEAYDKINAEEREKVHEQVRREVKHKIGLVSQELAALTEQTSASTEQLIASSNQVNDLFLHSADLAHDSRMLAIDGSDKMNELTLRMESIQERSLRMEASLSELARSSNQMQTIVRIVQQISSHTKLLSLNASIEAARAGQHGAGFAVVASEVKKLSEETANAVKQIGELIQQSNSHTQEVVESVLDVKQHVKSGQTQSERTGETFNQIMQALENNLSEISKVESELRALVKTIEEVGIATTKVASSAEYLNTVTQNF